MKTLSYLCIVIVAVFLLNGCGDNSSIHTNVTGKAGEMAVVISNEMWDAAPGKTIRESLAQPYVGLPQEEPLFDLINVPNSAFKKIFRTTRNILQTSISANNTKPEISFNDDVWAYPQAVVKIKAKNAQEFVKIFTDNEEKILSYFVLAEKKRNTLIYKKTYDQAVYNVLNKDFGITMKVPPGFKVMKQAENFIWVQYDTPEIFQGIVIYTTPYNSDSAFTTSYQVALRDSLLKDNVPGPTKGSYMATETRFDQINNVLKHNGNYASEMRGLWRVQNDFMGGPYISLSELDAANQQIITAFGFVYKPNKEKRNLLRQVEAMIYSLKLNNQADNDKLNKQTDLDVSVGGEK
jgi:hypothetical protein